jgi:MFS family permease
MNDQAPTLSPEGLWPYLWAQLTRAVLAPLKALRLTYLPLLMVYFAYGALGITAIADSFWVKKELTALDPKDLAAIGVWLTLPWTVKMVFGELVDTVAIAGSQRRIYVFIGAALTAIGLLLLAGAAAKTVTFMAPERIYVLAQILIVTGVVLQDVVADAMSTEVVPRVAPDGTARPQADIDRDLGMVQVLGRLALSIGIFVVAGLSGWLAQHFSYATVFLIGLVAPAISVTGAALVRLETTERRPIDWMILGGGLVFGAVVAAIGLSGLPLGQELVFVVSLAVVILMLRRVTGGLTAENRRLILLTALVIFVFRATPGIGQGYQWFAIDRLGFDEVFFGVLSQMGAGLGLVAAWLLSDAVTRQPATRVLLWLTVAGAVLALPTLLLVHEGHVWTERVLGWGARTIALIDAAAQSPLVQVSMIPMLTLIAVHAPAGHRATWFALMASLMNLALVAGQLATKYLNIVFPVTRGVYSHLPALTWTASILAFVLPLAVIMAVGPRLARKS